MKTLQDAKHDLKTITDAYDPEHGIVLIDQTVTQALSDLRNLQSEESYETIVLNVQIIRQNLYPVYLRNRDRINTHAFQLLILLTAAFPENVRTADTNYLICPQSESLIGSDDCLPMANGFVYHKLELFGADDEDLLAKYERLKALKFSHEELQFHFDFNNININTQKNRSAKKADIYRKKSNIHLAVSLFVYTLCLATMVASTALYCLLLLPLISTVGAVFAIGGLSLVSLFLVLATGVYITSKTKPVLATELAFSKWLIDENLKVNLTNDILANEMKGTKELLKDIHIYPQEGERSPSPTPSLTDSHTQISSLLGEPDIESGLFGSEPPFVPQFVMPGQFVMQGRSAAFFRAGHSADDQPGLSTRSTASRPTI